MGGADRLEEDSRVGVGRKEGGLSVELRLWFHATGECLLGEVKIHGDFRVEKTGEDDDLVIADVSHEERVLEKTHEEVVILVDLLLNAQHRLASLFV